MYGSIYAELIYSFLENPQNPPPTNPHQIIRENIQ
jgi:hypothetical protein